MYCFFFFMKRRPPRSTRTDTLFPYTTLFRSHRNQFRAGFVQPARRLGIALVLRRLPLAERAHLTVRLGPDQMQIIERRRAILGGPRTPCRDNIGARESVLGPPRGVHRGHRRQRCEIERIVARSEERRVGKAGVSTCRSRWSP